MIIMTHFFCGKMIQKMQERHSKDVPTPWAKVHGLGSLSFESGLMKARLGAYSNIDTIGYLTDDNDSFCW